MSEAQDLGHRKRFEPEPDVPYAHCQNCRTNFPDEASLSKHFEDTMFGSRSHQALITNPTRTQRIAEHLDETVREMLERHGQIDVRSRFITLTDAGIEDALEAFWELVENNEATVDEITEGLRHHVDLHQAWPPYAYEIAIELAGENPDPAQLPLF